MTSIYPRKVLWESQAESFDICCHPKGDREKNRVLKGKEALGGHVMKIGHFGLKKFLDPDLVYRISVILITSGAKTLEKIV